MIRDAIGVGQEIAAAPTEMSALGRSFRGAEFTLLTGCHPLSSTAHNRPPAYRETGRVRATGRGSCRVQRPALLSVRLVGGISTSARRLVGGLRRCGPSRIGRPFGPGRMPI